MMKEVTAAHVVGYFLLNSQEKVEKRRAEQCAAACKIHDPCIELMLQVTRITRSKWNFHERVVDGVGKEVGVVDVDCHCDECHDTIGGFFLEPLGFICGLYQAIHFLLKKFGGRLELHATDSKRMS